jgi:trimethylamine--corrinoid protein Co-methyltransferase
LIPSDVPENLADRFRLLIALVYGTKPVITGTFTREAFTTMHELLCAVRGGREALRDRPLAVFDCCPTAPLVWSDLTCDALVSCARTGVPVETVSMPLTGATSPVTLAGAIVQHTAESLSGLVIHQAAGSGSPFIYGGAPSCFDMRKATTPMGSVETMMIDASYAQVGRYLGLPTHAYMGLSDAKLPDYQAGLETAFGVVMAALAGVNIVSGPGMLNFVGTQSLEKLFLDGEICAMAARLLEGVSFREPPEALDVIRNHTADKSFLTDDHTRKYFRQEAHFPCEAIDRGSQGEWEAAGRPDAVQRAHVAVRAILDGPDVNAPDTALVDELESIIMADARGMGVDKLPDWRSGLPG